MAGNLPSPFMMMGSGNLFTEELTHKHLERVNLEDILAKIAPLVPGFSREKAVDTLDKLVNGEILAEKNLNYCFKVNMTRKWIATRHPLRKVRG